MKKLRIASLMLLVAGAGAQQPSLPPPQTAPDIPFDVQGVIKMPPDPRHTASPLTIKAWFTRRTARTGAFRSSTTT